MNIRDISKPVTAKALNESLAKRFGKKINIEAFTIEQLEDARNKLRTTLSQFETNESFDTVHSNDTYQKNKLFLDVLNAAIAEADVTEDKMPDKNKDGIPDYAQDGKGKNDLGKGAKPKAKKAKDLSKVPPQLRKHMKKDEGKEIINNYFRTLTEGEEDKAEIIMASKDMVDRITGWMEDTAEMQAESMLELGDAIRDEMGQAQSDSFIGAVKPALESLYTALESTRGSLTAGVAQLTGEGEAPVPMGDETPEEPAPEVDAEADMEPTVDAEAADDFATAEPAAGGEEEAGREKRESKANKGKALKENDAVKKAGDMRKMIDAYMQPGVRGSAAGDLVAQAIKQLYGIDVEEMIAKGKKGLPGLDKTMAQTKQPDMQSKKNNKKMIETSRRLGTILSKKK